VAQTVQAEIDALARMQSQAAQGLKTAEALVQASAARPVATGPLEVARELTPCSDRAARGALDGTLRWVSLLVRPVGEAAGVSSPWLPSVEVVLLTAVVAWGLGRPRFREFFSRWPHVAGIVAGAAWWLWLQPAAVGAVLAAGSALWLAHALRRSRRGPRPSNTR
jgi:hypothetical protein